MTVFYFIDGKVKTIDPQTGDATNVYSLSSTSSINITSNGVVTSSPIEDGGSITDNFYLDNKTATFTGLITNVRVDGSTNTTDIGDWIQSVQTLRKDKKLLTLTADTEVLQNCVITTFNLDKTKDEGTSAWKCTLTFKEVDISERARLVAILEPKPEVSDEVAAKVKSSSSGTKEFEGFTEVTATPIAMLIPPDA